MKRLLAVGVLLLVLAGCTATAPPPPPSCPATTLPVEAPFANAKTVLLIGDSAMIPGSHDPDRA